jgi:DNA-directed RNA polymerase specialized sigma24 family protein
MDTTHNHPPSPFERLRAVSNGDADAIKALVAEHRPELVRYVARQLGGDLRRRIDASDVVQEALAEAIRRLPAYLIAQPMPFDMWLKKTAQERLIMERRRHTATKRAVFREVNASADAASMVGERAQTRSASLIGWRARSNSVGLAEQSVPHAGACRDRRRTAATIVDRRAKDRPVATFRWLALRRRRTNSED